MISSEDESETTNKPYVRRRSKTTSTSRNTVTVTAKKRSKSSPTLNINLCSKRPPPYSTSASTSPLTPLTPYTPLTPLTPLAPITILPISMPLSTPMTRDDSDDDDDVLWHAKRSNSTGTFNVRPNGSPPQYTPTHKSASTSNSSLRARIFSFAAGKSTTTPKERERERLICTKPGEKGAGETETEVDEPPKHLPTARSTTFTSLALSTPHHKRQEKPLRFLYQCFRLLAVVPAFIGVLWCVLCIVHYDNAEDEDVGSRKPDRVDYVVSILWALLTAHQCHALTSGLLTRWQVYYPPLPTLIRLLGLQAICWPATQMTMTVVDVGRRPVVAWAVVGTSTCCSRAVQIWVTSNLWWDRDSFGGVSGARLEGEGDREGDREKGGKGRWRGGRWGGRRWDWNEVVWKCILPPAVVYCVMAWVGEVRREWTMGC